MFLSSELVNLQVRPDELRKPRVPRQKGEDKNTLIDTHYPQRENRLFTHLPCPLHHIRALAAYIFPTVSLSLCVEGSCSPVRARTLQFQASSSCAAGQLSTFCFLWSCNLLFWPFPFSFTLLLMEFEIQFSLCWTLAVLEMPRSLCQKSHLTFKIGCIYL